MFEKVNPQHPDKVADRIAGAIVDLAYRAQENPKIAVEVLLGHGRCNVIIETSLSRIELQEKDVEDAVMRIAGMRIVPSILLVGQDEHLNRNQKGAVRCGDNGIFRGIPVTEEQRKLKNVAHFIYKRYGYDGKYIIDGNVVTICQSHLPKEAEVGLCQMLTDSFGITYKAVNPLGAWTGGTDVDCGATNRKLGSDMGDAVTGGGLHGKDLSKADVSVNIACHLIAKTENENVTACCSIGDEEITFRIGEGKTYRKRVESYEDVVKMARGYIQSVGGFEKFAEWGLIA